MLIVGERVRVAGLHGVISELLESCEKVRIRLDTGATLNVDSRQVESMESSGAPAQYENNVRARDKARRGPRR